MPKITSNINRPGSTELRKMEEDEDDGSVGNTGHKDNANPSDTACATPGTSSGVERENNPDERQEPALDMARVRLTYEAHPQYFPWKVRNDPVPQLIQNHGCSPSQTNSPCSSRISSSTGDYMESTDTDSRDYIKSPDENDGDDEEASSDDNEDQFSTFGTSDIAFRYEDARDAFGDDEGSQGTQSHPTEYFDAPYTDPFTESRDASGSGNDGSSESNDNGDNENAENNETDQDKGNPGIDANNDGNSHEDGSTEKHIKGIGAEVNFENDDALATPEEIIEEFEAGEEEEDIESADVDLTTRFQRNLCRARSICEPETYQSATHISNLPLEMIFYVLRWVVSQDLDLRSLEMFSMVCRGFYICSRDFLIWKSICTRVFGNSDLRVVPYRDWRMMFLSRPRLNFNGCYVSTNTYIRYGEDSFRDRFYRPWHMVVYYRYLRFFPEGMVLMQTSTEPNRSMLDLLGNSDTPRPSFFIGYYMVQDDRVSVVFCRNDTVSPERLREILSDIWNGIVSDSYRMEFQLISLSDEYSGMLLWRTYMIVSKQGDYLLDVTSPKYPPFWFSGYQPDGIPPTKPL